MYVNIFDIFILITASDFEKFDDSYELTKYKNSVWVVTKMQALKKHEIKHYFYESFKLTKERQCHEKNKNNKVNQKIWCLSD